MTKKVLIVDDAIFMRLKLKNILEENGYEVVGEAENGYEAIDRYKELQPDIVTMDVTMPVLSGLEALKEIRDYDADATVIICSAICQKSRVDIAIHEGASDVIIKPFDEERVLRVLNKIPGK